MNEVRGRLAGKVAIVTGAAAQAPGIGNGSAVAHLYAREGASVILVNRSEARATALCEEIVAERGIASVVAASSSFGVSLIRCSMPPSRVSLGLPLSTVPTSAPSR